MIGRWVLLPAVGALLLATSGSAVAAIYRWVDEDGVVVYTDDPWQFESYRRQRSQDGASAEPGSGAARRDPADASARADGDGTARPGRTESATEEVMRLAGLDAQTEILEGMAQVEFERLRWRFPRIEAARPAVARALGSEALRRDLHRTLARHLDPQRTGLLLAWLRTPLSRRIVALESAPTSAARAEAAAGFVDQLPSTPPAPARLALVHRVDRAGDVTASTAVVMDATSAAVLRAVAAFMAPRDIPRGAREQPQVSPTVDELFRFRIMTSLLFTYRDLRDEELGRYATFLESPTGRWFTQIIRAALVESLQAGSPPLTTPARAARR